MFQKLQLLKEMVETGKKAHRIKQAKVGRRKLKGKRNPADIAMAKAREKGSSKERKRQIER